MIKNTWLAIVGLVCWMAIEAGPAVLSQQVEPQANSSNSADSESLTELRDELIEIRTRLADAHQARNLEALINELGPDAVLTWQNADCVQGHQEIKAFYARMFLDEDSLIVEMQSQVVSEAEAVFYGNDMAISTGSNQDRIIFRDGRDLTLESKWTAVFRKHEGSWSVASYHVSANVLDNPILDSARKWVVRVAVVGSLLGFAMGAGLVWFMMISSRRLAEKLAI